MITCPWCGTHYLEFKPNCQNCGGPLPLPPQPGAAREEPFIMPPPAPRPIADSFAWKLLYSDGWFIAGMVLTLIGGIFSFIGIIMTLALVTLFIGLPFALIGLGLLGGGLAAVFWRYRWASAIVRVLQAGQSARGEIASVEQNLNVRVNGRSPWEIVYRFSVLGSSFEGRVSTLKTPSENLRVGSPAAVLYLPENPAYNAIYPHP